MKLLILLLSVPLLFTSCSGSKSSKDIDESSLDVELSDSEDFKEDEVVEEANNETAEVLEDAPSDEPVINDELTMDEGESFSSDNSGTMKEYVVQKNETLMLIAFKLYGDYSRWREIAAQNPQAVKDSGVVLAGSRISYNAPSIEFNWSPSGNPYLIKNGDTLGTISNEVYQTPSKWKMLWENNKPMIKDPNKIYAGFTLYYLDGREVASEI